MTIRAVIVEDREVDRYAFRRLLAQCDGVELVGESGTLDAAQVLIGKCHPDLIFLDIGLGGASGFDLLERLDYAPWIVFVTAHDRHAVRAFEVNAVDYLLKPVDLERLRMTVARLPARTDDGRMPATKGRLGPEDQVFLKDGPKQYFIPAAGIAAVRADGDYSHVYAQGRGTIMVRRRMKEWDAILPEGLFATVDRSLIVNVKSIRAFERKGRGEGYLHVNGVPEPFVIGQTGIERFSRVLAERRAGVS